MDTLTWVDGIGLFLMITGFVLGLGAVTVIDIHGFLGRQSSYWTEATTRTHKVTKPLIWAGIILAIIGGIILYRAEPFSGIPFTHAVITLALIVNGAFLSFRVSPFMIEREKEGRAGEILPQSWQHNIMASMMVSNIGWWSALILLVVYLVQ